MNDDKQILDFIARTLNTGDEVPSQIQPILKGGSDRTFHRVRWASGMSCIFMWYNPAREENNYYAGIAHLMDRSGLRVPRIFNHDAERHFILMEDLGERDLWAFRLTPWRERRDLYEAVLSQIVRLHACDPEALRRDPVTLMPDFDVALYRWEHHYFLEQFVGKVCGISLSSDETALLSQELDGLTRAMMGMSAGLRLVHRDFQSQNIMISFDGPALVDFQGTRFGNPLYDLGSLLYDPYVPLAEDERMALLAFYRDKADTRLGDDATEAAFRMASSQRLMQALGAYGYLGLTAGRRAFLGHIPSGLENLIDASGRAGSLPQLHALALRCRASVPSYCQEEGQRS